MSANTQPSLNDRVDKAINDPFLKQSLSNAQERFRTGKDNAADALGNLEEWRTRAEAIRTHTISNLDYYLDQFSTNVEKNGGKVLFANDDAEVVKMILDLCREKEAKSVIKSKSMVSEEVHLNARLEEIGVEPIESDLGEYIIQLAKEMPSHIIVPAIHKNRKQVAELFSEHAGRQLPEDTKELTKYAREVLRDKFMQADIGLTGCNFAIAETGSIVLVSNEGNARLTTTVPKTHIVLMGMERIVPGWKELDVVLSLLPRSATGQKITSYVTAINGPRKLDDRDGPEELIVIIVDNGRSNALGTEYQQILNCIRCGACLNVCPVYRHIGGHAYGSVYPGPIGAVLTPILEGFESWGKMPYLSSLCGACTDACPVKIPLHEYLVELRQDVVNQKHTPALERLIFKGFGVAMSKPWMYKSGLKMAKYALKPFQDKDGYIRKAPSILGNWTKARDLPAPPMESFREWWQKEGRQGGNPNGN
ncbi:LutB/LldF family L-lactate oxidation iron-sulfur protein [Paenibacillus sp. N1-5-1-14]|uniref:LutB/LldF family L-lactate oxidation iron-sulfur protein n=1 Tax=Paenibacillus radicibacter TaxID=2972488 RepID=UPI0021595173|nr:LutB/LldF family L-lactate oxidation iron-sulfur protein [Paenibacillus radicibacter]MCR8643452.1 LutB/LldF family L-lactate oxidation iron-sulfur protein [Paenibacillus radicibacter]